MSEKVSQMFVGKSVDFVAKINISPDWKYLLWLSESLTPLDIMEAIMPSCSKGFQGGP